MPSQAPFVRRRLFQFAVNRGLFRRKGQTAFGRSLLIDVTVHDNRHAMQFGPVFCEARRCLALDMREKRCICRCERVVQVFDAQRYIQVEQLATDGKPSQSDPVEAEYIVQR